MSAMSVRGRGGSRIGKKSNCDVGLSITPAFAPLSAAPQVCPQAKRLWLSLAPRGHPQELSRALFSEVGLHEEILGTRGPGGQRRWSKIWEG